MKRIISIIASFAIFLTITATAQETHFNCGNVKLYNELSKHPEFLQSEQDLEEFTAWFSENGNTSRANTYIIPVVFHIIHNFGVENITDAQVYDALRVINEDFQKRNADTATIIPLFKPIAADCSIEFRLARKDPNGNCTNGIDRVQSPLTYVGDDNAKLNPWPRNKYLNIWVVNSMEDGVAGYAYAPSGFTNANVDGIIILHNYIGAIGTGNASRSHALSHEIGHWFNLRHTWGNTNNPGVSCGDDQVNDTPETKGWTSCNLNGAVCSAGVIENVQNFMEYSYCYAMFTNGQKTRMHAALNSSTASRNNLWTAANLTATGTDNLDYSDCSPKPVLNSGLPQFVCEGGTVNFSVLTTNAAATSWNWSFPGGSPSSSTSNNPAITYASTGTYNVSVTTSNTSGSNSTTANSYVVVLPQTAQKAASTFSESFETTSFPNTEWIVDYPSATYGWKKLNTTGATGTNCLRINAANTFAGMTHEFVTPTFDFTGMTAPKMNFKIAFAQKTTSDADNLRIYASVDCGKTWTLRYSKSGTSLSTVVGVVSTAAFTPNASQWRDESVNLSAYAGQTNVRFKFQYIYKGGNNFYLDDINFGTPTSVEDLSRDISLSVFPNPVSNGQLALSFNLTELRSISVSLISIDGRETTMLSNKQLLAGHQLLNISVADLPSGTYILNIRDEENNNYSKQVIIR
jgi:PKD repeat protein